MNALAHGIAAVVNGGVVSVLIAAAVWLLLRVTPRVALNAATRYAIWWVALVIVIALPVVYLSPQSTRQATFVPPEIVVASPGLTGGLRSVPTGSTILETRVSTTVDLAAESDNGVPTSSHDSQPLPDRHDYRLGAVASIPSRAASRFLPQFPIEIRAARWLSWLLFAWIAISMVMLTRLVAAVVVLERRKARAFAAPVQMAARLEQWLAICGTRRRIVLASSAEIATPMAAGLRAPLILIPAQLFSELDAAEMDQIGLHEAAHLGRRDDYALIAQRTIEALFALHPVVRWIARRIDLEREIACDDFVIEATGRARPYAACLTRVVELAGGVRGSLIAAAATEEPSHLARRVEMLLDKKRHTGTRLLKFRLIAVMVVLAGIVGVIATVPGAFAFSIPNDSLFDAQDQPPQPPVPAIPPAAPRAPITTPPLAPGAPLTPPTLLAPGEPPAPIAADAPLAPETPLAPMAPLPAEAPQAPPAPLPASKRLPFVPVVAPYALPAPKAMQGTPAPLPTPRSPQGIFPSPAADPRTPQGFLAFAPQAPPTPPSAQAPTAPAAPLAPQGSFSSTVHSRDGVLDVDWHWRDGLSSRDIRMHGRVEFTDDESDVKSMEAGGWFSYEESHGFSSRKYQVTTDSSGAIKRQYLVDGRDHPFDEEARAWLRANLPEMLRESAVDAPERVRRLLKRGGPNAVLAEIAKIRGSGARRRYIEELVPIGNLNTDQYQTLLRDTRNIPSDGDKSSVLIFLSRYTLKDNLRDYVFDAVSTINSSGDRRRVLMSLIQQDPSPATLTGAAKSAEQIAGDGDKAAVLVELARHYRGNESMRRAFFRAAESIHSSGDRARVLIAMIGEGEADRDMLADALHATTGIPGDGDKARVLVQATSYWKDDDPTRRAFFEAANSVNSSGDRSRVLINLAGRGGLSAATWTELVHSADRIPADGDKARVLLAVIERSDASSEALVAAVQSAARLNSEGEKARVLLVAIERSSGKPAVRSGIRNAVRAIHSDGEYRRVMSALDRQMAI